MRLLFIFSLFFCSSYALGGPSDLISCKESWKYRDTHPIGYVYIDFCLYIRTYDTDKKFAIISVRRKTEINKSFRINFDFHESTSIYFVEISDTYDSSYDYATVFEPNGILESMQKRNIANSLELDFNGSPKVYVFKTENDSVLPRFTFTYNSGSWLFSEVIFNNISVSDKSTSINNLPGDACIIDIKKGTGSHVFYGETIPHDSFAEISIKNTGSKKWNVNFIHTDTTDILRRAYTHHNVFEDNNGQKINPQSWMEFNDATIETSDTERMFYLVPSYSMKREDLPSGTYTSIVEITCD
ncbi:hypothetical protein [Vibrio sp.]|uniref:hypothetical protein n=1 Tax=Vibrio sp. TaxID=678 RepID=UPI00311E6DE9